MPVVTESHEIPLLTRAAPVRNYDATQRTFEVVWTTGAKVRRYDWMRERWFDESLSLDPAHVRLERLASGKAPLLDSHRSFGLSSILGVVERAELSANEGVGTIRFSKRQAAKEVEQDVQDGIINDISVGYRVRKFQMIPPAQEGDVWEYRAVEWEPYELSLVAVGADEGAGVRSADVDVFKGTRTAPCEFINAEESSSGNQEKGMFRSFLTPLGIKVDEGADEAAVRSAVAAHLGLKADVSTDDLVAAALNRSAPAPVVTPTPPPVDEAARALEDAKESERKRAADLITFCVKHRASPETQAKAIADGWSLERTGMEILNLRAAQGDSVPTNTANSGETRKRSVWDELAPATKE